MSAPSQSPSDSAPPQASDAEPSTASGSQAPLGVILIFLFGLLGIAGSVIASVIGTYIQLAEGSVVSSPALFGLAIAQMLVLVGLLEMEAWARTITVVVAGFGVLLSLVTLNVPGLVAAGLVLGYLLLIGDKFD